MRIIVFSDSHGDISRAMEILDREEYDLVIHLGDYSEDGRLIREKIDRPVYQVRGNCDYYDLDTDLEQVLVLAGKKFFLSHGHDYGVKHNYNRIFYRGLELGADIVLFGHSHRPLILRDKIILFNPGSISLPQPGEAASYGLIRIEDGQVELEIKNF